MPTIVAQRVDIPPGIAAWRNLQVQVRVAGLALAAVSEGRWGISGVVLRLTGFIFCVCDDGRAW
jgi:hypothetical protein